MGNETKVSTNRTPEFRVAWPNVFKPKLNDQSGKEEFSVTALFPANADLSNLKAKAQAALVKKFGADQTKWPRNIKSPFRDQADLVRKGTNDLHDGAAKGCIFIKIKSYKAPIVFDQKRQEIVEERFFYGGCYAVALVNASAYDVKGNAGVSFWFDAIQKTREGDPLGGRSNPESEFEIIEELQNEDGKVDGNSLFI